MADLPSGLLDTVKNYVHITWSDDSTDALVTGYINRGMARLQQIAGTTLDFTAEDLPRSLLLDYCRYANSQALEVFEKNFQSKLLELNFLNQAPIVGELAVSVSSDSTSDGVTLDVAPSLSDGDSYQIKIGSGLTVPAAMDVCAPPDWAAWDGVSTVEADVGQDIIVAEVDDACRARYAGKVTVSA